MFLGLCAISALLRKWFVSSPVLSIVSVCRGLASMEKTVDHCDISLNELDCKLVLVFHCKPGEERESERERDTERERDRDRNRNRDREKQKEKERKNLFKIRNGAEVEHTSFLLLIEEGYQDCEKPTGCVFQTPFSKPNHWSIHISERKMTVFRLRCQRGMGMGKKHEVFFNIT